MSYAIFKTGGKQYKVKEGDRIDVEKLDFSVGDQATFEDVLLINRGDDTVVGAPFVDGAKVTAEVVDQHLAKKVLNFKYKRRKGYHRSKGHRRHLTRLEIKGIEG